MANHQITIIQARRGFFPVGLRELWEHHELLFFLVWRDLKVRYKQTALGIFWVLLQPSLVILLLSLIFGVFAKIPTGGAPYPLFVLAALLPWNYFSQTVGGMSGSLLANSHLVQKVYFPRMVIPMSVAVRGLVDSAVSFAILPVLMLYYGVTPTDAIVFFPFFLVLGVALTLGAGIWISALSVKYRDVSHMVPFLIQLCLFGTPVIYGLELIPARFHFWFGLNPMTSVVEGFRWTLLGSPAPHWHLVATSSLVVLVILVSGVFYFRKTERTLADKI